jgi:hypothetical protein
MVALSNKKIYYKFGDVKTGEYSKEYVFHVPPAKVQPYRHPSWLIAMTVWIALRHVLTAFDCCEGFNGCLQRSQGTQPVGRGTRVILFDVGRGTTDDAFTWYEYGRPGTFRCINMHYQTDSNEQRAVNAE